MRPINESPKFAPFLADRRNSSKSIGLFEPDGYEDPKAKLVSYTRRLSWFLDGTNRGDQSMAIRALALLPGVLLAEGRALDEQRDGTNDWKNENAQPDVKKV